MEKQQGIWPDEKRDERHLHWVADTVGDRGGQPAKVGSGENGENADMEFTGHEMTRLSL
jgi:hypothetical protein